MFPRLKDEATDRLVVKYGALAWKASGVDELADHMTAAGNKRVFTYRFDWGGEQPHWLGWGTDGKTSIVLDTPQDRGIRMMDERVTRKSVVNGLATDPEIPDQRTRCRLYVATFSWGGQFDQHEYESLASESCRGFDPETLGSE